MRDCSQVIELVLDLYCHTSLHLSCCILYVHCNEELLYIMRERECFFATTSEPIDSEYCCVTGESTLVL